MKIDVLFFGLTADLTGSRSIEIEVGKRATASEVLDTIIEQHPALIPHRILIAVNEEYVPLETVIRDGDELAMFTAVSGG